MHEFALILTFQVIEIWFFAAMVLQGNLRAINETVQSTGPYVLDSIVVDVGRMQSR